MKFFFLIVFAVLMLGCAEPSTPVLASATPIVSVTLLPTPTSTPIAEPSPSPTIVPSPTPVVVPTLAQIASTVGPLAQAYFNDSQPIRETSPDVWSLGNDFPFYRYSITVSNAKYRWVKGSVALSNVSGDLYSNEAQIITDRNDRLFSGGRSGNSYYGFAALLKCFNQKYDVQLVFKDYVEIRPDFYRQSVGSDFIKQLVDVCPA